MEGFLEHLPNTIDPGWATLVSAFLGFGALWWQARSGFKQVVTAHEKQAERDREARADQAAIDRQAREEDAKQRRYETLQAREDEKKALAAALAGELSAASMATSRSLPTLEIYERMYKSFGSERITAPQDITAGLPALRGPVYESSIDRLGLLGPSTLSDVAEVYQFMSAKDRTKPVEGIEGNILADSVEIVRTAYAEWLKDANHVIYRLMAIYGNREDPGTLLEERQRRKETSGDDGASNPE